MGVTIDKIYLPQIPRVDGVGHDAIAAVARSHAYGVEERPQKRVAVDVHEHRRPRLLKPVTSPVRSSTMPSFANCLRSTSEWPFEGVQGLRDHDLHRLNTRAVLI